MTPFKKKTGLLSRTPWQTHKLTMMDIHADKRIDTSAEAQLSGIRNSHPE
jgi:hypothetical protein